MSMSAHRHLTIIIGLVLSCTALAGGNSRLWLRFDRPDGQPPTTLAVVGDSALDAGQRTVLQAAESELRQYWTGDPVMLQLHGPHQGGCADCALLRGTAPDAFTVEKSGQGTIRILSSSARGLLYGAFFILRSQLMGDQCLCATLGSENRIVQQPADSVRAIALDDDVAALSRSGRLDLFARANASVGVNTIVLTAAGKPRAPQLQAMADTLQRYGLRLVVAGDETFQNVSSLPHVSWQVSTSLQRYEWYVAGRRLWDAQLTAEQLAYEWLAQTYTENPLFVMPLRTLLADPSADRQELLQQLSEADERFSVQ